MSSITNTAKTEATEWHPDADSLSDFVLGKLDEPEIERIEKHLDECLSCCEQLATCAHATDVFVSELKSAATVSGQIVDGTESTQRDGDANRRDTVDSLSDRVQNLPKQIGRFSVHEEIGHGGFGIVLLCHDPQLSREVAVKIPRFGSFTTPDLRKRFLREAQAAAALDHPNIMPIYEAGEADGIVYITSAFCRGPNLSQWLKQQPSLVTPQAAAVLISALASGVEHAHSRGVLHRDLKPGNVLLEPTEVDSEQPGLVPAVQNENLLPWVPKLTDFGLAKLEIEGADNTRSNIIMGTACYMSPEQALGRNNEITPASDVYSMGSILYELVTGRPPLVGESDAETIHRILHEEPLPPSRLRPKLPRDLETICLTCLRKEPALRYKSAAALIQDLRSFLAGDVICARPAGRLVKTVRWCRRKPALASLCGCIAVLVIALITGSLISALWLRQEQRQTLRQLAETEKAQERANLAEQAALRQERKAKLELFSSLLSESRANRLAARAGYKFNSLELLRQAAELATSLELDERYLLRLRNEVIALLPLFDMRVDKQWPVYPLGSTGTGIAFDAELEKYAAIDSSGKLVVRAMVGNTELWQVDTKAPLSRRSRWWLPLGFSPDGKFLIARGNYVAGNPLHTVPTRVWDVSRTDRPIAVFKTSPANVRTDFAFSPDSRSLALHAGDQQLVVLDLASGEQRPLPIELHDPSMLSFDPSGERLAIMQGGKISTVNALSGKAVAPIISVPGVQVICWSADGQRLVSGSSTGEVKIWNCRNAELLATCEGHGGQVIHLTFVPNSEFLISSSWANSRVWNASNGSQLMQIDRGMATQASTNGKFVGLGVGASAGRYEIGAPEGYRTLAQPAPQGIDCSPDGRLLLTINEDKLSLWNTENAKLLAEASLGAGEKLRACFDTSGKNVLTATSAGVHIWPIRFLGDADLNGTDHVSSPNDHTAQHLVLGPPRHLERRVEAPITELGISDDGCLLTSLGQEVHRLKIAGNTLERLTRVRSQGWSVSASGDGRWLSTSSWHHDGIRIWDARSGQLMHTLPGINSPSDFSPDSKTLLVCNSDAHRFYDTNSWTVRHEIDCNVADRCGSYSRHGNSLVILPNEWSVRLLKADTLEELATFELPFRESISRAQLSPDGRWLIAVSQSAHVHIWDLAFITRRLNDFGLNSALRIDSHDSDALDFRSGSVEKLSFELGAFDNLRQLNAGLRALLASSKVEDQRLFQLLKNRAKVHVDFQRWSVAIEDFNEAIRLASELGLQEEFVDLYYQCGLAHYRAGQLEAAAAQFDRVLELDSLHVGALRGLGHTHHLGKRWEAAYHSYSAASQLEAEDATLLRHQGEMLFMLGRFEQALEVLDRVLSMQADAWETAIAANLRGKANFALGNYQKALSDGEWAVELDGQFPNYSRDMAWALANCPNLEFRDPDAAVAYARRAIGLYPTSSSYWKTLALAYFRQGDLDAALGAVEESMAILGGGDAYDWLIASMITLRLERPDEARTWYQQASRWLEENAAHSDQFLTALSLEVHSLFAPVSLEENED